MVHSGGGDFAPAEVRESKEGPSLVEALSPSRCGTLGRELAIGTSGYSLMKQDQMGQPWPIC